MSSKVDLVLNADPRHDQLMNAHFASLNSALDSKTRNSLAILENNSEKGVVGYVVKWAATRNDVSQSRYEVFDRLTCWR